MVSSLVAAVAMQRGRAISKVRFFNFLWFLYFNNNKGLACTPSTLNYGVYWCPNVLWLWCFILALYTPFHRYALLKYTSSRQQFASMSKWGLSIVCGNLSFADEWIWGGCGDNMQYGYKWAATSSAPRLRFQKRNINNSLMICSELDFNLKAWFFRFAQNFIDIREREAKEKATGSQRSGRWARQKPNEDKWQEKRC